MGSSRVVIAIFFGGDTTDGSASTLNAPCRPAPTGRPGASNHSLKRTSVTRCPSRLLFEPLGPWGPDLYNDTTGCRLGNRQREGRAPEANPLSARKH